MVVAYLIHWWQTLCYRILVHLDEIMSMRCSNDSRYAQTSLVNTVLHYFNSAGILLHLQLFIMVGN